MTSKRKMKSEHEEMLMASIDEAITYAKTGKLQDGMKIRAIEVSPPEELTAQEIAKLRKEILKLSQVIFALICNVGESTVQNWEAGKNKPQGATMRLLEVFRNKPEMAMSLIHEKNFVVNAE